MNEYSEAVEVARNYYNSDDADAFYAKVWGGEDIHVGVYESSAESIFAASRRTIGRMLERVRPLTTESRVLDLGGGYGGTARLLARQFGCHVTVVNLSEKENERNRRLCAENGLAELVEVRDGSFQSLPLPDDSYDLVWSQDALLHGDDRARALGEAYRVLKPGGQLVFTDPMQSDDCPSGVLGPILKRIHLETLGSPRWYRDVARSLGFREVAFDDQTPNLIMHYSRVLEETERREGELAKTISAEYLKNMKAGLRHWSDGGENGWLCWAIFCFEKP